MGRLSKRLISIVTSVVVATSFISAMPININAIETVNEAVGVEEAKAVEEVSIDEGVMLHAWNWSFNNIKDNMKEIADSGYTSVQTSPAQGARLGKSWTDAVLEQTNEAPTWYYLYQPTYFEIGNEYLGTEEEFKAMCSEAKKYGVKIVVDVVLNHLADVGANGAGKVDENLYADARRVDNGTGTRIDKWNEREQVTQGCCIGMPDINTKSEKSQKIISDYMESLAEAGADGYRFDAAKSIELPSAQETGNTSSDFWPNIMNAVKDINKDSFFYGEVLQGDEPGTNQDGYVNIMRITGSTYSQLVRYSVGYDVWQQEETINGAHVDVIRGEGNREGDGAEESATTPTVKNIVSAIPGAAWDQKIPANKLVAFVETHDLYANAGATRAMSVEQREVAWAILGARKEVVPLFFNRPVDTDFGTNMYKPQGSAYIPVGQKGSDDFKSANVVAVNKFHKAMRKESEKLSGINNNMIMKAERGDKGIILANVGSNKESISTETSLADGTYENKGKDKGTFTVSGGTLTGELNGLSIAVLSAVEFDTPGEVEVKEPTVSVSEKDGTIFEDKLELTLKVSDAESATYSIDGDEAVSFEDGDKITIGEEAEEGEEISIEIVAKNGTKQTKKTFKYTKKVATDIIVGDIVVKSGSKELKEGTDIIFIDSINITIEAKDADKSTYKIDSGKEKTFEDSVDIQIGKEAEAGDVVKVVVEADYGDEVITKTYSFTKEEEDDDAVEPVITVTANDTEVNEDDTFELEGTADVTLSYDEADSATYKIGDNDEESFEDGDVITIGEELESGETIELTVVVTNGDKEVTKTFVFKKADKSEEKKLKIKNIPVDNEIVKVGEIANIEVEIEGGTGEVLYKFVQRTENDEDEFVYSDFSKNNKIEWSEQSAGKYIIEVTVKDDNNSTDTKEVEITVEDTEKPSDDFKASLLNKEEMLEIGKSVKLQAKAENYTGTPKYLFQYKLEGTDTWYRINSDYSDISEIEWTPSKVGTYNVCVLVKDDEHDNHINSKVVTMTVKEEEKEDPDDKPSTSDAKTLLPFAAMLALAGVTVSKTFKRKEKK